LKVPKPAAGPSHPTGPVKTVVHAVCARVVPRLSNMRVVPMEVMALALMPPDLELALEAHWRIPDHS
jgi:hypothetical protein